MPLTASWGPFAPPRPPPSLPPSLPLRFHPRCRQQLRAQPFPRSQSSFPRHIPGKGRCSGRSPGKRGPAASRGAVRTAQGWRGHPSPLRGLPGMPAGLEPSRRWDCAPLIAERGSGSQGHRGASGPAAGWGKTPRFPGRRIPEHPQGFIHPSLSKPESTATDPPCPCRGVNAALPGQEGTKPRPCQRCREQPAPFPALQAGKTRNDKGIGEYRLAACCHCQEGPGDGGRVALGANRAMSP